ncbi:MULTISPECIES: hypothetical protein [unclassified Variovorax]|uniref:hypothetical protein n=1 Tax=unclassified Variovorax TaxID=663243 RepID=UPI003F47C6E7
MTDELGEKVSRILESARPVKPCAEVPAWHVSGNGHLVAGRDINIINSSRNYRRGLNVIGPKSETKIFRWAGYAVAAAVAVGSVWWLQFGKSEAWARRTVQERLTDPGSALFRNLHSVDPKTMCGEVNAKNSMGGYTGYKRFVVTATKQNESWATIESTAREVEDEAQVNQIAATLGQDTSRQRFIGREVFAVVGSSCRWN